MNHLDLKEIPPANTGDGDQDTFEQFSRDFFDLLGYRVVEGPDRGADGGRDLIAEETRTGPGGETTIRWLVSCKHYAHSGKSVSPSDEQDIKDRLAAHRCSGFIGFYSTIPSAGLCAKLKPELIAAEVQVFDARRIESALAASDSGIRLASRYFPKSIGRMGRRDEGPVVIFSGAAELACMNCGKDLLLPGNLGVVILWLRRANESCTTVKHYERIYWCCKGYCDQVLESEFGVPGLINGWKDIGDLMNPTGYVQWVMATLNTMRVGATYTDGAFDNLKKIYLNIFPYVARQLTEEEKERVAQLSTLPSYLGGMGE